MSTPAETLILPFKEIWLELAAQTTSWATVHRLINDAVTHPERLNAALGDLGHISSNHAAAALNDLKQNARKMATEATALLGARQSSMVYPALVGTWAIVESALDGIIKTILVTDPESSKRLEAYGVKLTSEHPAGTAPWAEQMYGRVEKLAKQRAKGSIVEIHRSIFSAVGLQFDYPADRSRVIEELNEVRNCILHSQGVLDQKAAERSPRLAQYKGHPVPANDPVFMAAPLMIQNYTLAWVAALMHGPLLSAGLKPDAKNPFVT